MAVGDYFTELVRFLFLEIYLATACRSPGNQEVFVMDDTGSIQANSINNAAADLWGVWVPPTVDRVHVEPCRR